MCDEKNNEFPGHFTDVDRKIYEYLSLDNPTSFLLFAGAGSGKTRTLVNVLEHIKQNDINHFIDTGSKIAVITFTNAACNEIKHRLQYDPAFSVSTIHSFAWDLIRPFTDDIRNFLRENLQKQIDELQQKIDRARDKNGKTAVKNAKSRDKKQKRLEKIDHTIEFNYSPTAGRPEKDALNHAEVIDMAASFISKSILMQTLLTNRFPILLIDESQDTNKGLMNALIAAQQSNKDKFILGLFGDMMQRIYGGGKEDLDSSLPEDWEKPAKKVNYRCPKRIITLINNIRLDIDGMQQEPSENAIEGYVRLFIVNSNKKDKYQVEKHIKELMSEITQDESWGNQEEVKCLTLEHAMAAERGNFVSFFDPLAKNANLRDSVLDGTSQEIRFISNLVLPLVDAIKNDELFETARLIKHGSTILSSSNEEFVTNPIQQIESVDTIIDKFKPHLLGDQLNLREVIKYLSDHKLLEPPDRLIPYLETDFSIFTNEEKEELDQDHLSWSEALQASIPSVKSYSKYINETSGFATHQGVKGLEFDRVMAVLDDESAGGFLFKYEKLLGAEPLSATDIKNEDEGKDSTPLRTRRLFYVICSRAEKSLAVVAYTKNPEAVKANAIQSWFREDEVTII